MAKAILGSDSNRFSGRFAGGFAVTRPAGLYLAAAVAVGWDIAAFTHLFHITLGHASVTLWWPFVWLFAAIMVTGRINQLGSATPWWAWVMLGIGILAVASDGGGMALSVWMSLAIVVWPDKGRPWWGLLVIFAMIHALAQWGLLLTWVHLPTFVTLAVWWITGLGMLFSVRGSNWRESVRRQ